MTGEKFKSRPRLLECSQQLFRLPPIVLIDKMLSKWQMSRGPWPPPPGLPRELAPIRSPAISVKPTIFLLSRIPLIRKHLVATFWPQRERMRSSSTKWNEIAHHYNDEEEAWFHNYLKYKLQEEHGPPGYFSGAFSCPTVTSLGTTLPKTRLSTFQISKGLSGQTKLRKRRRNS